MAKYYDIKQGDDNWFSMRLGIPTASEFSKIITPAKQEFSTQSAEYADLKIAEIMTGEIQGMMEPNFHMRRGQILEVQAREAYEFAHDVKTENGGFWTDDTGSFGASPDFLIGDDGIGEIKCLSGKEHVKYLLNQEIPNSFKAQIQGQLYITERDWCDWWLYHPDMPSIVIRAARDDAFILNLSIALGKFREMMSKKIEELQAADLWQQIDAKPRNEYSDNMIMAG